MTIIINNVLFVPNESTQNLSTYGCKGYVKGAYYPKTNDELIETYNYLTSKQVPFKILGNGSNILFSPRSQQKYIISLKLMPKKVVFKKEKVYFSAGVSMPYLAHLCYQKSLSGLEELSSIPGTMGGIIKMNAGAFGKCIFDMLEWIKVVKNGKIINLQKEKVDFGYRQSNLDAVILGGALLLKNENKCKILERQNLYLGKRLSSQPSGKCCGSVFKNPPNESAGKLIEGCGLKGISKNDAEISNKHANFIINKKDASFEDIFSLIQLCEDCVYNKFKIKLNREVEII